MYEKNHVSSSILIGVGGMRVMFRFLIIVIITITIIIILHLDIFYKSRNI